jgi:hypothetical protein
MLRRDGRFRQEAIFRIGNGLTKLAFWVVAKGAPI